MAYDDEDDVLDIDAAAGLDEEGAEKDEMDGFHEVDPITGSPVVVDTPDEDEDDDDDLIVNEPI